MEQLTNAMSMVNIVSTLAVGSWLLAVGSWLLAVGRLSLEAWP